MLFALSGEVVSGSEGMPAAPRADGFADVPAIAIDFRTLLFQTVPDPEPYFT